MHVTEAAPAAAVAAMGNGPLTEAGLQQYVRPLFSRVLAGGGIYLANHTLGRMPDQAALDVAEGLDAWATRMRGAWEPWLAEQQRYREAIARLLGMERADCVVPKASAGQALRAVLNTLAPGATVLTTRGEFVSVSAVLEQYAAMGRIRVSFAAPEADGRWTAGAMVRAITENVRLVVVSHVFYQDGQVFAGLPALGEYCRGRGADLLVDSYHAAGVLPFAFDELQCSYLIGGCYKYLRGGPGAAFLALAPPVADNDVRTLDVGWFAGARGGDRWLEATPAVLSYYQARAGLALVRALGVERLRQYSLEQMNVLRESLAEQHIRAEGGREGYGAFLSVSCDKSAQVVERLQQQGIIVDAREGSLRLCPDVLNTEEELLKAAAAVAESVRHSV